MERVGPTNSLGLMAGFGEHKQIPLERETLYQRPTNERRMLNEQKRDHLESVSVGKRAFQIGRKTELVSVFLRLAPSLLSPELLDRQQADPPGV